METYYPPTAQRFVDGVGMTSKNTHTLSGVPDDLVVRLRHFSGLAEAGGTLTPEQLSIVYEQKWFKLFVPQQLGGLELSLPEGVRLEEELARIDGSLGWTVTLCAGANLFVGYVGQFSDQPIAETVFADPQVCLGGSGQASGRAVMEGNGYRVSGRWRYATGAPHLTHFTANCVIEKDGETLLDAEGNPVVRSFFFPKSDVQLIEDWNAFGLKATASHSFAMDGVWADSSQAFVIAPEKTTLPQPVYQYPFLQFAEVTLAANTLGMVRHFLECAASLAINEGHNPVEAAEVKLAEVAAPFYHTLDASWRELLQTGRLSVAVSEEVSFRSRTLVKAARAQAVAIYPLLGMAGADELSEANRVWRDIFTASQHSLLR